MNSLNRLKIAPSLLAADFTRLKEEIEKVEKAGCQMLHIDVMDGHFVPNITVGPMIVKAIRSITSLDLDTHLMIECPAQYIESFVRAGSSGITVHQEACSNDLAQVLALIRKLGVRCGVSLRPRTDLEVLQGYLEQIDMVLLMTVEPGFGGQAFMPEVLPKIRQLRKIFDKDIQVDGGINRETAKQVVEAGANVLVAGTAIFGSVDVAKAIGELRCR